MADIKSMLGAFRQALEVLYGQHLVGLYLFGSYARGDADRESDIDVLVVLSDFELYGREVDRTSQIVADLSLKHGVTLNCVFVREEEWRKRDSGFLRNVRDEAIAA